MGKTLGVLSGVGHLPVDVVRGAKKAGYRTVAIALVPGTHEDLEKKRMSSMPSTSARWARSSRP